MSVKVGYQYISIFAKRSSVLVRSVKTVSPSDLSEGRALDKFPYFRIVLNTEQKKILILKILGSFRLKVNSPSQRSSFVTTRPKI